jgi:RNA polymerase sigma-70 factor (ECF subfamily)
LLEVFVLFEIEGLPTPEIAKMINIPVGTAASRLRRAREEFRAVVARLERSLRREEER